MVYQSDVVPEFVEWEEAERLKGVASWKLSQGNHGDFLKHFLDAYLRADPFNTGLLVRVMQVMEQKYHLKDGSLGGV